MIIDQYGRCFFDETYNGHSAYAYFVLFDPVVGAYPRIPSYLVSDESVRSMGMPLSGRRARNGDLIGAAAAKYHYSGAKIRAERLSNIGSCAPIRSVSLQK
jgi:hypothetical protein